MDYAVFDLETTGLDVDTARIVELAVKAHVRGEVIERQWLVRQDERLPAETVAITGITDEEVEMKGVTLDEALVGFAEVVKDLPLIGHNAVRYDAPLMRNEFYRAFGSGWPMECEDMIDTAAMFKARIMGVKIEPTERYGEFARRVLGYKIPGLKYSLTYACAEMGVKVKGLAAHRAAADVEMTDRLYVAMASEAADGKVRKL